MTRLPQRPAFLEEYSMTRGGLEMPVCYRFHDQEDADRTLATNFFALLTLSPSISRCNG
jgi:hypothetical protein